VYGKVFDSMYTGTLYGQWQAIITFQQMIVLCDADGILDMTPPGIAAITSIPLEIIQKGLEVLSAADPYSRTPGSEGRRIELIDAHRPWGWHIVNHEKYKMLVDAETVRAQNRERQRRHREFSGTWPRSGEIKASNAPSRSVTLRNASNAPSRHTDTDTDTDKRTKKGRVPLPDWLPVEPWEAWLETRRKLKAPNTERALKLAIEDLEKFRSKGQDPSLVLDMAIKRGWRGLFPVAANSAVVAEQKKKCAYCTEPAIASVNGIDHCRAHSDDAYGRKAA
jgi:hypothetical protein